MEQAAAVGYEPLNYSKRGSSLVDAPWGWDLGLLLVMPTSRLQTQLLEAPYEVNSGLS